MKDYQPQLGALIRDLRGRRTQEVLAEEAGIDVRTVRKVERGKVITPTTLAAIAGACGLDVSQLKERVAAMREKAAARNPRSLSRGTPPYSTAEVARQLDDLDARIGNTFGQVKAPTRAGSSVNFSSRRLIASLSALGIPLDVVVSILEQLPTELDRHIDSGESLSTHHIRAAVARLISGLSPKRIERTETYQLRQQASGVEGVHAVTADEVKFDWASRYARRYGSPTQAIQVMESDGTIRPLDYQFLKGDLLPKILGRLLGSDLRLDSSALITGSVISQMAQNALEEFRRLGLYTVRYKTALYLAEDLAIQPPHPWLVTAETQERTIEYDFERAETNVAGLEASSPASHYDAAYRYAESLHHIASAVLAVYGGFLGHRETSSMHLLKQWLSMQEDNEVLWVNCELRMIESDLRMNGLSKQDLSSMIKRLEVAGHSRPEQEAPALAARCREFLEIAHALRRTRRDMRSLDAALRGKGALTADQLTSLARETAISCLGCRKLRELRDPERERVIGFTGRIVDGSVSSPRAPLTIFLLCEDLNAPDHASDVAAQVVEQLQAHRRADSCIVLCAGEPTVELRRAISALEGSLPQTMLGAASLFAIRDKRQRNVPVDEIVDDIFGM